MNMIVQDANEAVAEAVRAWLDDVSNRASAGSSPWFRNALVTSAVIAEDRVREALEESDSIEEAVGVGLDAFFGAVAERLEDHRDEDDFDPEAALTELREQVERDAGIDDEP